MAAKILIIDDDIDSLKLIGILLQRHGYQVITAPNGNEGLSLAASENPDLILLDVMMPSIDGIEVCRQLKKDPQLAHIPVLMFTAKTRVDDKAAGFDAGADDYLTKPTHPAELASRIKALLARQPAKPSIDAIKRGKVIAVLGIKGGSGVTTTAINLSLVFAGNNKTCILAELQPGKGSLGLNLGLHENDALSRLLQYDPMSLDQESLEKELIDFYPGLRLLTTIYNPSESFNRIPQKQIERIITLLSQMADVTILDLGSSGAGMAATTLKLTDHIVVCIPPGRASYIMAESILFHLDKVGISPDATSMVSVSISPSIPSMETQELKSQLNFSIACIFPAEPDLAQQASDQGKPILLLAPDSLIAERFRHLGLSILSILE
ncbi:MAG: response regulator [Anaerolineales bacterium]|nr:response regulator [Anaerolineales bacterium]